MNPMNPMETVSAEGAACPQQLQQSKLAKRGMKFIEEKRFIYSSNSGV